MRTTAIIASLFSIFASSFVLVPSASAGMSCTAVKAEFEAQKQEIQKRYDSLMRTAGNNRHVPEVAAEQRERAIREKSEGLKLALEQYKIEMAACTNE